MKKQLILVILLSTTFACNTQNETNPKEKETESIDLSIVTQSYLDAPPNTDIHEYQMAQFRKQYAQYEFDKIYDEVMKDERMIKFMEFNGSSSTRSSGTLSLTDDLGFSQTMVSYFDKMTALIPEDQQTEIEVPLVQQELENIKTEINGDTNLSQEDKEALLVSADMYIQNLAGIITIVENENADSSGRVAGWFTRLIRQIVSVVSAVIVGAFVGYASTGFTNLFAAGIGAVIGLGVGVLAAADDRCFNPWECSSLWQSCDTGLCL